MGMTRKVFSASVLDSLQAAIRQCEARHSGQIAFAVEHALGWRELVRGVTCRDRAREVFSQLRVWDTEQNNGVLIYLLMADRQVEIVADRGIHQRVGSESWETLCRGMEKQFSEGRFEEGLKRALEAIGQMLEAEYPHVPSVKNELPDRPVIL